MVTIANRAIFFIRNASFVLLAATLSNWLSSEYWLFDLFVHFRFQYLIISVLLLIVLLLVRSRDKLSYASLFVALSINVAYILPDYAGANAPLQQAKNKIKIASLNLNWNNKSADLFKAYITQSNPDIIFVFELTPYWADVIQSLKNNYPYAQAIVRDDQFGIGIISKFPLSNSESLKDTVLEAPLITAQVEFQGKNVRLMAAHPFPPVGELATKARNEYLQLASSKADTYSDPTLMCGDLNVTRWSPVFTKMESRLNSIRGFGRLATWPTDHLVLRIPIDHCLISEEIRVHKYSRGPSIGSDHFPIEIEISLAPTH